MRSHSLCPPNLDALTDDVIGTVRQRQFFTAGFNTTRVNVGYPYTCEERATKSAILPGRSSKLTHLPLRERQRIYKQRYRMKQQSFHDSLEDGNIQLRQDIKELQSRIRGLSYAIERHFALWSVVTDYFRLFRHGLHAPNGSPTAQLDFLRLLNAPDVVAAIAKNWGIFTHFFQDVEVQLQRLEKIGDSSIIGTTITSFTISRRSLMSAFPHLFHGSIVRGIRCMESRGSRLVRKMVDQHLIMRGSVRFDWDNSNNRIERIYSQIDILSSLLQLLGNVEDVSFVFNGARITPDGNVVGDLLIPTD
ncbi:hypothetical protein F441_07284 [Phytophthora nicotianae CJ01A1]|uniref:BZIP domain-containing protein n=3 Tax=Phytophthora nicotianae TaxID=4792 RepID=W2QC79_PHYN3|nr:hypothetical protein PPTG_09850 [Phytophthora nicotianae INRA-310]ETK88627.1 hypothetical protein L915_07145 [Phytophthora nicotianae]ETP18503.1 hypothetical protein F441_07284 [Phytophthora nicotianae CJ01A1]ETL42021.1 hypothetical protein L916_07096 [Phytophthora nicotianae]ETL95172.1 hypothetical protein L917_06985 [Phytophthora nicotianae]ETN10768.1 hypothetical protein PPTG_09850 [Phytophthora nicotianae INRA-310]